MKAPQSSRPSALRSIRVIGGSLRNSKITVPQTQELRPSADRIRETLFNWLSPYINGAHVVDLFAGTGILGIEAISRGAQHAVFVEKSKPLAEKIEAELTRLKVLERAEIRCTSAQLCIASLVTADIYFLDPPFDLALWPEVLETLVHANKLKPSSMVYIEAPKAWTPPPNWLPVKQATAGAVQFGLYRYAQSAEIAPDHT